MSTATPTRETVSRGLRSFLQRLSSAGWEVEAPGVSAPLAVSYCLIAHAPQAEQAEQSEPAPRAHLIYVYEGLREIQVEDLWRLVSDTRLAGADDAIMCLGPHAVLTPTARTTAAKLHVRVLRLQS